MSEKTETEVIEGVLTLKRIRVSAAKVLGHKKVAKLVAKANRLWRRGEKKK